MDPRPATRELWCSAQRACCMCCGCVTWYELSPTSPCTEVAHSTTRAADREGSSACFFLYI